MEEQKALVDGVTELMSNKAEVEVLMCYDLTEERQDRSSSSLSLLQSQVEKHVAPLLQESRTDGVMTMSLMNDHYISPHCT